jgi:hypothetical protein
MLTQVTSIRNADYLPIAILSGKDLKCYVFTVVTAIIKTTLVFLNTPKFGE